MCLLEILDFDGFMVEWTWKENERARESLLNPQGPMWYTQGRYKPNEAVIHSRQHFGLSLKYSVTNQLSVCLKFSSLCSRFGDLMKSDRYCPHTSDEHTFSSQKEKIAVTLTLLTKCSDYKLLLLLLCLHVYVCIAKQLNIVHLNYLIIINIIAWNSERVMYRVIIGCVLSHTPARVYVVNKHSSRNIECVSIQFLSSSYTDPQLMPRMMVLCARAHTRDCRDCQFRLFINKFET